jgi:hypothetical protein
VLSTYLDAQEHLPYADDSNAVTPMSEENGAIIVPVYTTLGSRHSSYTSHASRLSYTSHGDLLCGKGMTKESRLRCRSRNPSSYVPEVIMDSNSKHARDFVSKIDPHQPANQPTNQSISPRHLSLLPISLLIADQKNLSPQFGITHTHPATWIVKEHTTTNLCILSTLSHCNCGHPFCSFSQQKIQTLALIQFS